MIKQEPTYNSPQWRELIEKHLNSDPTKVAMATGCAELATAIKYLQRAKTKLPQHYEARCYISATLFEQSSSQRAADAKFEKVSGISAIDLTCGLGVDSFALSKKFERVDSIEIDSTKADIAHYNFNALGANNITVHNTTAEEYIKELMESNTKVDLIYLDPSRIKEGKKVYSLEDSSPNIIELLPQLLTITSQVMVKLSPLYDVEECYRVFGDSCRVSVLSSENECKEVLVLIAKNSNTTKREIEHIILTKESTNRVTLPYQKELTNSSNIEIANIEHIYVPDVAFYKARTVDSLAQSLLDDNKYIIANYIFTQGSNIKEFPGQSFQITQTLPYKPKLIKQYLKSQDIKGVTIHLRNFPYSIAKIKADLKIKEGADAHLFCSVIDNTPMLFFANKR